VIGISSELVLEVTPEVGVTVARRAIADSSTATGEAQADIIKTGIRSRNDQKGSRKLRFMFNLLSSMLYK
jgi:hypothetical protein